MVDTDRLERALERFPHYPPGCSPHHLEREGAAAKTQAAAEPVGRTDGEPQPVVNETGTAPDSE